MACCSYRQSWMSTPATVGMGNDGQTIRVLSRGVMHTFSILDQKPSTMPGPAIIRKRARLSGVYLPSSFPLFTISFLSRTGAGG